MRLSKNSIIALFAMLSIGCAHKESEEIQHSDVQVVIAAQFADAVAQTKVTTTAFESGDLLGLYAVKSGGELNATSNLINNHQLKVSASGAITGGDLPAYYPDKSSSLDLFSYYPYQSGNATADALGVLVGIRTHQTDFSSLQASDLCYGRKLSAAPSAAPHPLQFNHSFAQLRLNFSLYEGCSAISSIKLLSIKDSAKLNLQTGVVTLLPHTSDVDPLVNSVDATNPLNFTAIIPAQSLSGPCVEITLKDGTIYYYHATTPIALQKSATNTLNLNIVDKKVITASGAPAITAWGVEATASNISESTDNAFTFYWSPAITSVASIDKAFVTLTNPDTKRAARIEATAFVRDAISTAENAIFRFSITRADAESMGYPVTIDKLELFNGGTAVHTLTDYYGRTVTRSGAHTFGTVTSLKLAPEGDWLNANYTKQEKTYTITTVGTTKWTASISGDAGAYINKTSGTTGQTLTITWSYNATATARTARVTIKTDPVGVETIINTTQNAGTNQTVTINGLKWTTGNLVANGPNSCVIGKPTDHGLYFQFGSLLGWKGGATGDGTGICTVTNGKWFGNASSFNAANEIHVKPSVFTTIANIGTTWPNQTINRYYFGLKTYAASFAKLRDFADFATGTLAASGVGDPCRYYLGGTWRLPTAEEYKTMCNNAADGSSPTTANAVWQASPAGMNFNNSSTKLFVPASGCRNSSDGAIYYVGMNGYYWSESVYDALHGYSLHFHGVYVYPQHATSRQIGFPVRCVQ